MAYDDTKWGGFAKIIVDTSTMTVGDTVRVKSITTGTNYDKQVVTVGTPLIWETDIYKDYVKICMVQTINDTPTEIGGVYREVDYGQTLYIDVIDKTTLGGIKSILNAHQESNVLEIGGTVKVISSSNEYEFEIVAIDLYEAHEVIIGAKNILTTIVPSNSKYSSRSSVLSYLDSFYNGMSAQDKSLIANKTVYSNYSQTTSYQDILSNQKVWLPTRQETTGDWSAEASYGNKQFPKFVTASQRVKSGANAQEWQVASFTHGTAIQYVDTINESGASSYRGVNNTSGVVPFMRLLADS